jgi:nucleoside-diphosphate-sugar epimerase
LPTPEDYDSSYPLQPYAASKKGAEALCHAYHYLYGIDATVVRYFTVYGPAGRPDMVLFRFVKWISEGLPVLINGDGNQSRGFTYVDDIARGTILAAKPLESGVKPGFEIINLGGHETITINELLHMVEQKVGRTAQVAYGPLHPADMLANWANVEKAKRLFGWEPKVSLSEGIGRLVNWYQAERSWVSQVNTD